MDLDTAIEVARQSLKDAPAVNYVYLKYQDSHGHWFRIAEVSRAGVELMREYIMDFIDNEYPITLEATEYQQKEWDSPDKGHIL